MIASILPINSNGMIGSRIESEAGGLVNIYTVDEAALVASWSTDLSASECLTLTVALAYRRGQLGGYGATVIQTIFSLDIITRSVELDIVSLNQLTANLARRRGLELVRLVTPYGSFVWQLASQLQSGKDVRSFGLITGRDSRRLAKSLYLQTANQAAQALSDQFDELTAWPPPPPFSGC